MAAVGAKLPKIGGGFAYLENNRLPNFPAHQTHAYNPLASVAGVFRETFAGRRKPALSSEP